MDKTLSKAWHCAMIGALVEAAPVSGGLSLALIVPVGALLAKEVMDEKKKEKKEEALKRERGDAPKS